MDCRTHINFLKKFLILIILIFGFVNFLFSGVAEDYKFAKRMYDDTLYEEAINKFNNIIDKYPTSEEAEQSELYKGKCYFQLKNFAKASQTFSHLIEAYPDTKFMLETKFQLAESLFNYQLYIKAAENYEWLLNNYPESRYTLKSLKKVVLAYKLAGNYNKAILITERLLQDYQDQPQIPEILLILSETYKSNSMEKEYIMSLQKIIADYDESKARWEAALELAIFYSEKKNFNKALKLIDDNLIKYTPRSLQQKLIREKARILFTFGKIDSARSLYKEYNRKFDDATDLDKINAKIIQIDFELGDYNLSLDECNKFIKNFPDSKLIDKVYLFKAKSLKQIEKYDLALQILQNQNLQNASKKLKYLFNHQIALILDSQRKYDQSIPIYLNLIQHYSDFVAVDSSYFHLARIYKISKKEYKKAIEFYQIILNTFPQSKLVIKSNLSLAECYEQISEYKKSYDILISLQRGTDLTKKNRDIVSQKLSYLKNFKIKNTEDALNSLLATFVDYLNTRDEYAAIEDIIEIYNDDLKSFESSIQLTKKLKKYDSRPEYLLLKAKAYYKLAQKYEFDKNAKSGKMFSRAKNIFQKLKSDFPQSPQTAYADFYLIELGKQNFIKGSSDYYDFLESSYQEFVSNYSTFPKIGKVYLDLASVMAKNEDKLETAKEKVIIYLQQAATLTEEIDVRNKAYAELGKIYSSDEKFSTALRQLQKVDNDYLRLRGNLLFQMGYVEYRLNHTDKALDYLTDFINSFPHDDNRLEGMKIIGEILMQQEKYKDALYYYEKIVKLEEHKQVESLRKLVYLYQQNNQLRKAIETSSKIQKPSNDDRRRLARIFLADGAIAEALLVMKKSIQNETDVNEQLVDIFFVANVNFANENYREALENYKDILLLSNEYENRQEKFPDLNWKQIAANLIISSYETGSRSQAEKYEKQFADLIEDDVDLEAELLLVRGIYYSPLDKDEAEDIFDEIIDDFPETSFAERAYLQKAILQIQHKNFVDAKKTLNEFIKKYPQSSLINNAKLKLGSINFSDSNYKSALENYQYVIKNDREGELAIQAIENFALTCKAMGEWLVAIEAYQLLQERVDSPQIKPKTLFEIAYCYYMDKKYDKAVEIFTQVQSQIVDPELQAETIFWIGDSYFQQQEYDAAIEELLQLVYNYSEYAQWFVNANIKIATAYENLEQFDKARKFYQNVIKRFSTNNRWGKEAQKLLDKLPN